jgi:GTP-binding protein
LKVLGSEFIISAAELAGAPPAAAAEVAFLGRSNVGKSSMFNALLKRRKLARVSNTPGRTRLLNFFEVRLETDSGERRAVSVCDLPGYGYAKAPQDEIARWRKMIERYLHERSSLRVAVALVDVRSGPTELDQKLFAWLGDLGRPVLPVVTKIDKLSKSQRLPALQAAGRALGSQKPAIGFSSQTGEGFDEVWAALIAHTSSQDR